MGDFTITTGTYDHSNNSSLTIKEPQTFKILLDALPSLQMMNAAYNQAHGCDLPITSVNRPWDGQINAKSNVKTGGLKAAIPGNSPHGWAVAIDFLTGNPKYQKNNKTGFNSTVHIWLKENGYKYGWINPDWANNSKEWKEPWHFEWRWMETAIKGLGKRNHGMKRIYQTNIR